EDLEASRSFDLNGIDATDRVECLHLSRAGGEHFLDLLGRTGEGRPARAVRLAVKHRDFTDPFVTVLQSDARGRVHLGAMAGVEWIRAQGPEGTAQGWPLLEDERGYPASVHGAAGGVALVPYMGPASGGSPPRSEVSLIELRGGAYVEDRFGALAVEKGYLRAQGLAPGDYELYLKASKTTIALRIAAGKEESGRVISPRRQLELGRARPLQIASAALEGEAVKVRLQGATRFTRVHVAATRYVPELPIFDHLDVIPREAPDAVLFPAVESLYVAGRDIGDEYRYILERQQARKFPGNMLARPGLLLNPWAIRSTETGSQDAKAGTDHAAASAGAGGTRFGRGVLSKKRGSVGVDEGRGFPNLDFLGETAVLLANLRPDASGVVTIPRQDLGRHQLVSITAVDPEVTAVRFLSLPETSMPFKDLRLTEGLDPAGHFTERKQVTIALKDAPFTVPDIATAELEVYDTLAKVHGLFLALSRDATLAEFGFVVRWPALTPAEKREKYSKYACHELSFFLQRKDPAFFEEVVKPHLRNKHHKTFLDRWLLEEDLAEYLRPWAFGQLNTVERILLASRIPGEPARVARYVEDIVEVTPVDPGRADLLFQTALRGRALDAEDVLGIEGAQDGARRLKELADVDAPEPEARQLASRMARRDRAEKASVAGAAPAPASPPPESAAEAEPAAVAEDLALGAPADEKKAESESSYFKNDAARRKAVRPLYRKLETTQEWGENNYYHLPIESQNADLVKPSAFWADFARHDGRGPFFSTRFAEASRSFTEMMLALAVLDLPFETGRHESRAEGLTYTLRPASPVVIFHKQIKEAAPGEGTPILVTQHYYRNGDRHVQVGAERRDKFVTEEFLAQVVYGCHVVVTNPTSTPQKLDVLLQVPHGAVPVLGGRATRSLHVDLEPYHTWTTDYFFYFPVKGSYAHFPIHVSKEEKLLAAAPPARLKVVDRPSTVDRGSWEHVSQEGTTEDVLAFLEERNLALVKLDRIAWRLRDRAVFERIIAALEARHAYDSTLWSYGVLHDAPPVIREYLKYSGDFVNRCGAALESPLLRIDPVEQKTYQHLEYWPLVNARAHRLGKERQILNDRFREQYLRLLNVLSYRPSLSDEDHLAVTYYLLLQDRVEEALESFERVRSGRLAARMQYDYLDAYLALYREDPRRARGAAERYASYPVDRWRNLFGTVAAQIAEIDGKEAAVVDGDDQSQVAGQLAATEPVLDLEVEGGQVKVLHRNLEECRVSYYLMDLELLFSRSPFVGEHSGRFSSIRPNATQVVKLDPARAVHAFAVPESLVARNVLVEVSAAGLKKAKSHLSGALSAQVIENYAQARVTQDASGKPLSGVYVKAYARMKDGGVRFYKDGYTDLRGRFDYGSLSTNELDGVDRFALLFLSPDHGAVVREAAPPKR
ncbi:MAG TPA: hypothetical protein VMT52_19890, partial [Planctomycetota bacterium]|nr:hypothetical protein [Planctomycetota bacterium]